MVEMRRVELLSKNLSTKLSSSVAKLYYFADPLPVLAR